MKNKIKQLLNISLLILLSLTGCDDNIPKIGVKEVPVESVELNPELASGITLKVGTTQLVAKKVTVLPKNATDIAQNFFSSDPNVATVSAAGLVTAVSAGTSEISIVVGNKEVNFIVTAVDIIIVPATSISLAVGATLDIPEGSSYDLSEQVQTIPLDANDIKYASSNTDVVTISDAGVMNGLVEGTATITVYSDTNNDVKKTLEVTVSAFRGEYPQEIRNTWSVTASHELFKTSTDEEKNSLLGLIDGDLTTNLCLVRPGKSYGSNPKVTVPSGDAIFFVVDMKESLPVNFFRLRHRNITQVFVRIHRFDSIEGSNDGINFTTIASDVAITNVGTGTSQESPDIRIPESKYRYLKFSSQTKECFFQSSFTSQGSSVQIQELYLGLY